MKIYLIGPGGAGKTTLGIELSKQIECLHIDLDKEYLHKYGDISNFIETRGYNEYALENVELYITLENRHAHKAVIYSLSSGFFVYPENIVENYFNIKSAIQNGINCFCILPSFDLEKCVNLIVTRQMERHYLNSNPLREEEKIINRFNPYFELPCQKIKNNSNPKEIAKLILAKITANKLLYLNF